MGVGSGGRKRDREGAMSGATGAAKRTTAATKTTAEQASGRWSKTGTSQVSSDGVGGENRAEGDGREESADKSAEWSCAETKGLETWEEAETAGGEGGG